jgi:hypothetical protein
LTAILSALELHDQTANQEQVRGSFLETFIAETLMRACLKNRAAIASAEAITVGCPRFSVFQRTDTLKGGHPTRFFEHALRTKFAPVLLLASLLFASGCCSVASRPAPPDSAGTKPHWHRITVAPGTNAPGIHTWNKLNPIWWMGNAREPHAPPWYRPNGSFRNVQWWLRNPFSNFSWYVIGVADKPTVRYGRHPDQIGNPNGGWNFAVTRRRIVYLPFVDYKCGRFEFYFGWRHTGNFGIKLNFYQRILKPANPEAGTITHQPGLFIWDQPIDLDPCSALRYHGK